MNLPSKLTTNNLHLSVFSTPIPTPSFSLRRSSIPLDSHLPDFVFIITSGEGCIIFYHTLLVLLIFYSYKKILIIYVIF